MIVKVKNGIFRIKGSTSPLVLFSLLAASDVFHHFIDHKNTHSMTVLESGSKVLISIMAWLSCIIQTDWSLLPSHNIGVKSESVPFVWNKKCPYIESIAKSWLLCWNVEIMHFRTCSFVSACVISPFVVFCGCFVTISDMDWLGMDGIAERSRV